MKYKSLGVNEFEEKMKKDLFTGKYKGKHVFKKGVSLKKVKNKLEITRL